MLVRVTRVDPPSVWTKQRSSALLQFRDKASLASFVNLDGRSVTIFSRSVTQLVTRICTFANISLRQGCGVHRAASQYEK